MSGERILVVDDEPGVRDALEGILRDEGYAVTVVESAEAGLAAAAAGDFEAVLLDVWLPGIDGLEALSRLGEREDPAAVVMISGHGSIETAVRATKLGAFDFIEKPLSLEKTLLVLRNALNQRRLERRNRRLLEQLSRETEIVGRSVAARRLREQADAAAASAAPVLICGEPGSGRESLARRIHAGSRPEGAFVEIPCDAIAASTPEGWAGRLSLAAGGSLFLREVDRLPHELQSRLALALAEAERGGLPARVLASAGAGAAGLEASLEQRLDVLCLAVPALRERREDIEALAVRMLGDTAREYGRAPKRLSPACLHALKTHDWPGNLVELRNLIERLALLPSGDELQVADLPETMGGCGPPFEDLYRDFGSLREALAAFERYYVRRVLAEENDDLRTAARRLGVSTAKLKALCGSSGRAR